MNSKEARAIIDKAGVSPDPGKAYYLFRCGCVSETAKLAKVNRVERVVCEQHRETILTKYRVCKCGKEAVGRNIGRAASCRACYVRGNGTGKKAYDRRGASWIMHKPEEPQKTHKKPKASPMKKTTRTDCIHRRVCGSCAQERGWANCSMYAAPVKDAPIRGWGEYRRLLQAAG